MRLVTVVGARPQFIKAAAFSRAARASGRIAEVLVHTGQHYDEKMSQVFFDELEIPRPDHHLAIGSGSHGEQTGQMLAALERVFRDEAPDAVMVYGDTNSTLAGALAAAKLAIPVMHVEAGLRSFLRAQPEEINRVLTDRVADRLFAPTPTAVANLLREGVEPARVHLVGDVMYDVATFYGAKAARSSAILDELGLRAGAYVLATVHRAENTDDPRRLRAIFAGLAAVAATCPVVVPLHPRTRQAVARLDPGLARGAGLRIVDPVAYLDMVRLEQQARAIVTDSGGVQKEAYFHHVPCVTLREATEWVELVEAGWNRLVMPDDPAAIRDAVAAALADRPADHPPLYGDGRTAERIVALLAGAAPYLDGPAARPDGAVA